MGDMFALVNRSFSAMLEDRQNFLNGLVAFACLTAAMLAVMAVLMAIFYGTTFLFASSAKPTLSLVPLLLFFGATILVSVLSSPISSIATMLYPNARLEGKTEAIGAIVPEVKARYMELLGAILFNGIASIAVVAAIAIVLGGVYLLLHSLFGTSLIMIVVLAFFVLLAVAAAIAFSVLTSLFIPRVYLGLGTHKGVVNAFMESIAAARARIWDVVVFMVTMSVIYIAVMLVVMVVSLVLGLIPCVGSLVSVAFSTVVGYALSFASMYGMLSIAKGRA